MLIQSIKPKFWRTRTKAEVDFILEKQGIDLKHPIFKQRGMQYAFGHYVGLAVHDVGGFTEILKPGMVLANEPAQFVSLSQITHGLSRAIRNPYFCGSNGRVCEKGGTSCL